MLRILNSGGQPAQWPVDPNAEFQAGQIAQLNVYGNNITCGVSDGRSPLGIIDDQRTTAFTSPSVDETVIAAVPEQVIVESHGRRFTEIDIPVTLENSNVLATSFITSPLKVHLRPLNGVIVFPAGTELNFDADGDMVPDSLRTVVSYVYQVPNVPGDDSTAGSGKVTVHIHKTLFQTDQYETNVRYSVNAVLYVSECGLLTTRRLQPNYPGVAMVTGPPGPIHKTLEAIWL